MPKFPYYRGPNPWLVYFDAHPGCDVPSNAECWRFFVLTRPDDARALLAEFEFKLS